MGKAKRNRAQNAMQRIALQQQAARRAEGQRRAFIVGGSVLLVIVIVVAIVVIKSLHKSSAAPTASTTTTATADSTVASELTSIPVAVQNQIGAGPSGSAAVDPLKSTTGSLKLDGKPEFLFEGAEYCPYCAAERWAIAVALSRFGTLSNLHFVHSSSTDVYASTPTLTFYGSTYTSKYITFRPVELYNTADQVLQTPTKAELALMNQYTGGNFPFGDVGGKYIIDGTQYLPSTFGTVEAAGEPQKDALTWAEVARDLQNPNSAVAQEVIGAANHITAAICKVTKDQPSNVCNSASVTSIGGDI